MAETVPTTRTPAIEGKIALDNQGFPIDLTRPFVIDDDGVHTEISRTIEMDGKWVNIPSIVDGKIVSMEEAVKDMRRKLKQGWRFPTFDSLDEAIAAAKDRSNVINKLRRPDLNAPRKQ